MRSGSQGLVSAETVKMGHSFRIPPAALGYLLGDCEQCFVRELRDRVRRPGGPSPVYNFADGAMKRAFDIAEGRWIDLGVAHAPRFRPIVQGFAVASAPLPFPEFDVELTLAGNLDAFVETDDGCRVLVDYKTSTSEISRSRYAGQLGAYAMALEHPACDARYEATIVDATALLVFHPRRFAARQSGVCGLYGPTSWVEVPRDRAKLLATLRRVASLLSGFECPAENDGCTYCHFRVSAVRG